MNRNDYEHKCHLEVHGWSEHKEVNKGRIRINNLLNII